MHGDLKNARTRKSVLGSLDEYWLRSSDRGLYDYAGFLGHFCYESDIILENGYLENCFDSYNCDRKFGLIAAFEI